MAKDIKKQEPKTSDQLQEKRNDPRVHADLRVKIFAGGEYFSGVSKNLSCGGVLIRAPKEVLGKDLDKLSLEFQDKFNEEEIDADVAWSKPAEEEDLESDKEVDIGFQFKDLDEEIKDQVQKYIDKFHRSKEK
jgi:c-di-GMP-binding flagellar brake protein YcgR